MRRSALVTLAAMLLTGSASALFGREEAVQAAEGAPTVLDVEITTYRDIPYEAQFQLGSGEGGITYAVEEEPGKGTVTVNGDTFLYTPEEGVTGSDRFTYTATDSAGRTSLPAAVEVRIEKPKSGVTYADTAGSPAAAAAQDLAERGVFTGARIGENYYFEPERAVSRSEFLAMALETAGREVTEVTVTGFSDDASIPAWAKSYAAAGVAEGLVQGKSTAAGAVFQGAEPITFNEAATVLNRLLDLGDVDLDVWFADREAVPSWAAQAVGNMEAYSVLSAGSFGSAALEDAVTRADAAQMLSAAGTLLEGREESGGLFDWLK